ncbi:MAG: nuclear transport factor 2 family protein [Bacteroidia bacterium]|nr:nuclear transport factor 2 family protein [Bacteroidia bacterium]
MKTITLHIKPVLLMAFLLTVCFSIKAQTKEGLQPADSLYKEIHLADSLLFDAFNKRDTALFNSYFSTDLEFYHDKGGFNGLHTYYSFLQSLISEHSDLKRELIKENMEVFPIPGYGAMEIGAHRFCHTENGKQDCGIFKFANIWKYEKGRWTITRVISYGHK